MKTFKLLLFPLMIFVYTSGVSQSLVLRGKVVDRFQNKPVPYATIGLKGKSLGTVADENGSLVSLSQLLQFPTRSM